MIIKDSISELKETKIWIYLQEINSDYAERAVVFVEYLTPILKSIQEIFPLYTRHDAHHSYRVLKRMSQVIHPDCLTIGKELSFNHIETFLLICSAYAHDLGMAIFPNEEEELLRRLGLSMEEGWKSNDMLQSHLRDYHSVRGGLFIDQHYEALNFPKNLVSSLDLLMKAHNMSINQLDVQSSTRAAGGESELNLRQLACILCVADSLEFSETRIIDGVLEILKERVKNETDLAALLSYRENMKHECIGDSLAIGSDNRIIISGTFDDPEVLNLAHKTIDCIEDWVRNYLDIEHRSPLNRLLPLGDKVVRNLTILGSDFVRLGIRIKKDHIIKLISSNSTWTNNYTAIKELLQNSVEACRYRNFNSSLADNYHPKVTVAIDKKGRIIKISDNGCGMSRNTILNNFLTVGNSRSLDPSYSASFKSLARFGIGFWSVFTIASEVDISTAPFESAKNNATNDTNGLQFSVSVSEFREYTVFKEITRVAGTEISINIKPEIVIDDLISGLNNTLLCSEIPIEIWNDDELCTIPSNVVLPTIKEITEAKYQFAMFQEIKEFVFLKQYNELELKMKLLYRTENNVPTFMLKGGHNSIMNITKTSGVRFATCGFAVNTKLFDVDFVFNLGGVGVVICNTNNPDGFIFNILRLELLPSRRQQEVIDMIRIGIHDGYREFLIENRACDNKLIYELNRQSGANYLLTSRNYTQKKLFNFYKTCPDLLIFKLFCIEKGKDLSSANVSYLNIKELCNQEYDIWSCDPINYRTEEKTDIKLLPYQVILDNIEEKSKVFFHHISKEFDMLFDNDPNSTIEIFKNPNVSDLRRPFISFMHVKSNTVVLTEELPGFICSITGIWSGTILEREIIGGSNYAFIAQHKLIVNSNSLLSNHIHELNQNGQIIKICKLVNLLHEADGGFVDESIMDFV